MNDRKIDNIVDGFYTLLLQSFKTRWQNFAYHKYGTTTVNSGNTSEVFSYTPAGKAEVLNFKWRLDDTASGSDVFFRFLINNHYRDDWGTIEAVNNDLFNSEVSFLLDTSQTLTLQCINNSQSNVKVNYHHWSWTHKELSEDL